MTITLHWWMIPVGLFFFPFIYRMIRPAENTGGYFGSMDLEGLFLGLICWALAIGTLIGHFI